MSETISGKIIDAGPEGLTIRAPYSDWQRFVLRRYEDVQVLLCDGRQLTPKQSRAIHAMVHDIAGGRAGLHTGIASFMRRCAPCSCNTSSTQQTARRYATP